MLRRPAERWLGRMREISWLLDCTSITLRRIQHEMCSFARHATAPMDLGFSFILINHLRVYYLHQKLVSSAISEENKKQV